MKYVVFEGGGLIAPVVFPNALTHRDVYMRGMRPTSAGFVQENPSGSWTAYGESETLKLKSNPERDSNLLEGIRLNEGTNTFRDPSYCTLCNQPHPEGECSYVEVRYDGLKNAFVGSLDGVSFEVPTNAQYIIDLQSGARAVRKDTLTKLPNLLSKCPICEQPHFGGCEYTEVKYDSRRVIYYWEEGKARNEFPSTSVPVNELPGGRSIAKTSGLLSYRDSKRLAGTRSKANLPRR